MMLKSLRSFRTKVTLALVFSMLITGVVSNYLIYEYSLKAQFNQLRTNLKIIAQTAALLVDPEAVVRVPTAKSGVESPDYQAIKKRLSALEKVSSRVAYVYIMRPTERKGILQFVVDVKPGAHGADTGESLPGDRYDASRFPAMLKAFTAASVDRDLARDEFGVFLSGYAPIRDRSGRAIAIIGVDLEADNVYRLRQEVRARAFFVLAIGILLSIVLGLFISGRVAGPIRNLVEGTRHVAAGNLTYQVAVRGGDEIAELGRSFNAMAADLRTYVEELKITTAERERFQRELEIAKGIQQSFLPAHAPAIPHADIAVASMPARTVGGDFYDFIPVGGDNWGLVIADVSGKGIPAALFMALSRTLIRASATGNPSVVDAIRKANHHIYDDDKNNMFVTLFYAIIDGAAMRLKYVNAGHNPPLLLREDGSGGVALIAATGIPLGLIEDNDLSEEVIELRSGDVITFYTDGVTEAVNDVGEQFETERLSRVIAAHRALSAQEIVGKIQDELQAFVGKEPQFDDITLMVLKVV